MRRRARPSARTTRTAPTAPCVPVTRDGARVPRSVPRAAGPVTGNGSCTSVEGGPERSTGSPGGPRDTPRDGRTARPPHRTRVGDRGRAAARPRRAGGLQRHLRRSLLRPLRLAGGRLPRGPGRDPLPGRGGRWPAGQRPLPGRPADRHVRRRRPWSSCRSRRCRPSCSCRSWRCGASRSTTRSVFMVLAAIDVALCWWAIGRLPVGVVVRLGTTVFFAFGTVFWYTAQISTTWYQAHIVAVGLTFLAIGIAVGADPESAEDETRSMTRRGRRASRRNGRRDAGGADAPRRATPVPRRAPARSGLHGAPDGHLRRPVLRLRRPGGRRGGGAPGRPASARRSRSSSWCSTTS